MNGHCWSRESQPEIFVSPQAATSQLSNSWENSLFAASSALAVGTQREKIRFCGLHLFPQATFCWEILCSLHRRIGRISNFKQFNICLFYRSKPEREMSFVYDPVVESPANDSWWQILWARLDLVDPFEHLRPEDALLERDD